MLVYGDAEERVRPAGALADLRMELAALDGAAPGLDRHGAAVALFIRLAGLAQGLIDAEAAAAGHDEPSALEDALLAAQRRLARAIDASWRSGHAARPPLDPAWLDPLGRFDLPPAVTVRRCEGWAFYAVYPEAYLEAARDLSPDTVVVGLRSIGVGLAALVAAAAGADAAFTVRPVGPPFARTVAAGPALTAFIRANAHRPFAIVDEGPGLSGSSFNGVADWLEGLGVTRIVFLPSHAGDLGGQASATHRARWATAERRVGSFVPLDAPATLAGWFADLTGSLEAMEDLSGGRWAGPGLPSWPSREARKYRLTGSRGRFLLRYAGLDPAARAKFGRARVLHAAGFASEPLAMRYGFLLERWIDGAPPPTVPTDHMIAYLGLRRDRLAVARPGASLLDLRVMVARNLHLIEPAAVPVLERRWPEARVAALQGAVRPIHVDARLHRWEWLCPGDRIVKTDALDHSQAHDLVGCQDVLWDVAGAATEWPALDAAALADAFTGSPERAALLDWLWLAYLAFQAGWWSMSGTGAGEARGRDYGRMLVERLCER